MTQQIINIGSAPNDGTGDQLRTSFDKCNLNFTELYAGVVAAGPIGNAIEYQFNNSTSQPPAAGEIRFNQATQASTTLVWASHITSAGINIKQFLSAATTGATLILQDKNDNTNYIKFDIIGAPVDKTTYWEFPVSVTASGGNLPNARILAAVTPPTGGGGGNVSNVGTPTNGQLAQWTDATHIQGVTTLPAAAEPAHTGDVTNSAGSLALTIANNAVTYAKMQDVSATARLVGRISAGAGDPEELTGTQATTLLNLFTSTLKGLVPASGGGTSNFLRADATWAAPPGGASPGIVLLNTLTATNQQYLTDTTSFTSAYDSYEIEFVNVIPVTASVRLSLEVFDGTSWAGSVYNYALRYDGPTSGANAGGLGLGFFGFTESTVNSTAGIGVSGSARLYNANGSGYKHYEGRSAYQNTGPNVITATFSGYVNITALRGIRVSFSSGNITSGTIHIYGRKTS